MLVIREAQMHALRIAREAVFRRGLLRYARNDCGARYAETGDDALLQTIEWAIRRGLRSGIYRPPDLDRFARFVLRHGRDFEETVAGAGVVLKRPGRSVQARLEALPAETAR